MAKLHFIAILLLCHTLLRVNGQSTSSSMTVSPTSTSYPSLTTSSPAQGQSTSSSMTVSPTSTSYPSLTTLLTSSPAQGQSSVSSSSSTSMPMSAVSISPTSTYTIAPSPSPSTSPPADGAQVNITIYVWVSTCSGASYQDASSPDYRELDRNLKGNLTDFYTRDGVSFMLNATLQTAQCTGNYVKVVVTITFKLGISFLIEVDIKAKISGNFLETLRVDGTRVEVAFIGVKITFEIKDGECKRVCCDGAGGPVVMVSSCSPQDGNNNRCQGFKSDEKQEDDHCHGEANDLCSSTCDSSKGNRAGSVQCPSFVLLGILAVATFLK